MPRLLEVLLEFRRHRLVLAGHEARQQFDDGDVAAEALEDRRELDADGAAAHDGDRLRHLGQVDGLVAGDDLLVIDGDAGDAAGARAGGDDDLLLRRERLFGAVVQGDLDAELPARRAVPLIQSILFFLNSNSMPPVSPVIDLVLAGVHGGMSMPTPLPSTPSGPIPRRPAPPSARARARAAPWWECSPRSGRCRRAPSASRRRPPSSPAGRRGSRPRIRPCPRRSPRRRIRWPRPRSLSVRCVLHIDGTETALHCRLDRGTASRVRAGRASGVAPGLQRLGQRHEARIGGGGRAPPGRRRPSARRARSAAARYISVSCSADCRAARRAAEERAQRARPVPDRDDATGLGHVLYLLKECRRLSTGARYTRADVTRRKTILIVDSGREHARGDRRPLRRDHRVLRAWHRRGRRSRSSTRKTSTSSSPTSMLPGHRPASSCCRIVTENFPLTESHHDLRVRRAWTTRCRR